MFFLLPSNTLKRQHTNTQWVYLHVIGFASFKCVHKTHVWVHKMICSSPDNVNLPSVESPQKSAWFVPRTFHVRVVNIEFI